MDRLTKEQSDFLRKIITSPIKFDTLTIDEKAICDFLTKMKYVTYHTVPKTYSGNGIFQSWSEIETISISEAGKMYLINEQLSDEQRQYLKEQMDSLKNIADSAETQAKLAVEASHRAEIEANNAKKDALFSKILAILSFLVSIVAIIVPLLI